MTKAETKNLIRANKRIRRNARLKRFAVAYSKLYVGFYSKKQHALYRKPITSLKNTSTFWQLHNSDKLVEVTEVTQIGNRELKNIKSRWNDAIFVGLCSHFVKVGS
jgi:hypothetical protein